MTGGAGFIGSHYVRSVLTGAWGTAEPDAVVVLDKLTYAGNLANLEPVTGRPATHVRRGRHPRPFARRQLLADVDAVVHFAAESHVDRSILGAADFVMTNVVGTQTLLDAALRLGIDSSSTSRPTRSTARSRRGRWDEEQPLEPNSPYSASKASSDLLARAYHRTHGLPVCVTRCSNNYGPYQFPEKVIPLFVTNLDRRRHGAVVRRGRPTSATGCTSTTTAGASTSCSTGGRPGEVYNIGGGTELTNKELTGLLLEATGTGWDQVAQVPDRLGHDLRYSVDITKIRNELGYEPQVAFEQGLADTVEWYRTHRDWWEPLKARASLAR